MGICPSSVIRPSFGRPCRSYLRIYCGDFFKFQLLLALGNRPTFFFFFFLISFFNFDERFFRFVKMGPYSSDNHKTLLLPQIAFDFFFQTSPEFSSQWSWQKYCFGFLKIESRFFMIFFTLTWNPMRGKVSKRYSVLKLLLNFSKLVLNFLPIGPHKRAVLDFWNFEFTIFHEFLSSLLTWDPMGPKTSNTTPSSEIASDFFRTSPELLSVILTKVLSWII